jgi:phosphoglucosamine mutase
MFGTHVAGKIVVAMLHFGTDGVRGRAGVDLHESDIAQLGAAVAHEWPGVAIVIGHDGRESGAAWLNAFTNGATAAGSSVINAGVVPTPALALASQRGACVGVSITASHNPWYDNGVKVFAPGGRKLLDAEQQHIEEFWHATGKHATTSPLENTTLSRTNTVASPMHSVSTHIRDEYVAALSTGIGVADFAGQQLVIDCANGATSDVAPAIVGALNLRPLVLHAAPNGRNINDACGATHPAELAAACAQRQTIGVAFDGDGDRVIAIDEHGSVVDGDRLIALAAIDLHQRGLLTHDTVVVTSMTNLGFHRAMHDHNIAVVTTDVGDRAVLAAMQHGGYVLGGEQSGHIIHARHATTGDGVLSAVLLLDLVRRRNTTLAALAGEVMERLPQVLRSVRVSKKLHDLEVLLSQELAHERALLGDNGRIVVRASGTEPVVRIMVEAQTLALANEVTSRLEQVVLARA